MRLIVCQRPAYGFPTLKVWWFHPILCLIFIFVPWDFQFCPEFLQLHITFSIINFGFSNGKKIDHLKHFNNKKGPCYLLYQKYCDLCIAGLFMFIRTSFFLWKLWSTKKVLVCKRKSMHITTKAVGRSENPEGQVLTC